MTTQRYRQLFRMMFQMTTTELAAIPVLMACQVLHYPTPSYSCVWQGSTSKRPRRKC